MLKSVLKEKIESNQKVVIVSDKNNRNPAYVTLDRKLGQYTIKRETGVVFLADPEQRLINELGAEGGIVAILTADAVGVLYQEFEGNRIVYSEAAQGARLGIAKEKAVILPASYAHHALAKTASFDIEDFLGQSRRRRRTLGIETPRPAYPIGAPGSSVAQDKLRRR